MNWRWISLTALLAALVIGFGASMRRDSEPGPANSAPAQPGYYLKDALITETQADGSRAMQLAASRIEQHPQNDEIRLTAVRANYFQAQEREWLLSARRGRVPADSRIVFLEGDVVLEPAGAPSPTSLRTSALAIDTEKNIAYSTSSPVSLQFGPHTMQVATFRADLRNEKISLESVRGRFEPR